MRRLALALLVLAVAGCGEQAGGEGEAGACADGIVWHDTFYLGGVLPGHPRRQTGARLEGGIRPACTDSADELPVEDQPADLWRLEGVSPQIAVSVSEVPGLVYRNPGAFVELPQHPFHENFFGSPRRPIHRVRGKPCTVDGRVESLSALWVAGRNIVVDARTKIAGFDQAGMPILHEGDAVRVHGSCRGDEVVGARQIEPQP
jgi:hypothetical protein